MQELYVDTVHARDPHGHLHTFHYYILSREICVGCLLCENLGVAVQEEGGMLAQVPDITPNRGRLEQLMSLLVRNAVTPINLPEVVQDWLES